MRINYNKFGVLQNLKNKTTSPFNPPVGFFGDFSRIVPNLKTYNLFWDMILQGVHKADFPIDYITEPIRKLVDDDMKVGDKLHQHRDHVPDSSGVFLMSPQKQGFPQIGMSFLYNFVNDEEKKRVYFTTMEITFNMVMSYELGYYDYDTFPNIYIAPSSFNLTAENTTDGTYHLGYSAQMALQLVIFKNCAELEIKEIDGNPKSQISRKTKIGKEKFLNEVPFKINIINSTYFTRIVRTDGFTVSAHWRWQPHGPGRKERKLIMIKEYEKHGYTKRAQIEN